MRLPVQVSARRHAPVPVSQAPAQMDDAGRLADRVAKPEAGQPEDLRESPHDEQVAVIRDERNRVSGQKW